MSEPEPKHKYLVIRGNILDEYLPGSPLYLVELSPQNVALLQNRMKLLAEVKKCLDEDAACVEFFDYVGEWIDLDTVPFDDEHAAAFRAFFDKLDQNSGKVWLDSDDPVLLKLQEADEMRIDVERLAVYGECLHWTGYIKHAEDVKVESEFVHDYDLTIPA